MRDERLSVRAAAGGALVIMTRSGLRFDPFAAPEAREVHLAAWRDWIDGHTPRVAPDVGTGEWHGAGAGASRQVTAAHARPLLHTTIVRSRIGHAAAAA
jgi:hypothetical protein